MKDCEGKEKLFHEEKKEKMFYHCVRIGNEL